MRVYFDNCIVSGEIRGDLKPALEKDAVAELRGLEEDGRIAILTSQESVREQERTEDTDKRRKLLEGTARYPKVSRDHELMGAQFCPDRNGSFIINPAFTDIVDPVLFEAFRNSGLKPPDARHLMYAEANECQRFITTDPDFFDVRAALEAHCSHARIRRPSELVAEFRSPL